MTPIEVVLAMLPTLSAADIKKVKQALGVEEFPPPPPPVLTACEKTGHKFRGFEKIKFFLSRKEQTRMVCEKCGKVIVV